MQTCPGCKLSVEDCYYGGDCLEMQAIYREELKEKLKDVDMGDLVDCMDCGKPTERPYLICYSCEHDLDDT